jgi:RIO kinase 1
MRDSADSDDYGVTRRGKKNRKFHDDESTYAKRNRHLPRLAAEDARDATDGLPEGDRWSTWDQSIPTERGPRPHPKWLVTDLAAVDSELGVLKTGKEADVFLIRRYVPGTGKSCLLAAKRYRDATHRQFHRDAGYLEGRRVRESRVNRAVANRSGFGRQAIAGQWANAEFNALVQLYNARLPVPYPVQILGTEVLLEFIGDADGTGAPRLAETRPGPAELASLWSQLVEAIVTLARAGFAHGDLSPYNLLVHQGRLVMIDLPQVVDVIAHPNGRSFLDRDARNVAAWFAKAGHPDADPDVLARLMAEEARLALDRLGRGRVRLRSGRGNHQASAAFTSSAIFFSTAGLHSCSAYDTGQISPSSRCAASWNSRVE